MGLDHRENSAVGVLSIAVIGGVAVGKMGSSLPDKVSSKARRDNLIVPCLVNRSLVGGNSEFLQDDGLVGLGRGSSVVGDPLRSPGLLVSTLSP